MSLNNYKVSLLGHSISDNNGSVPVSFLTDQELKTMHLGDKGRYGYPNFPPFKNVGGSFYLIGSEIHRPLVNVGTVWGGGFFNAHYVGNMMINGDLPFLSQTPNVSLDPWGPIAYHKMKPTKPSFSALNAAFELRELPGMLRQRFLKDGLRSIPNYWLALQFGWKPLLADIRNLVQTQMGAQARLEQLLRDEGRPVRRRIILSETMSNPTVTSGTTGSGVWPVFTSNFYSGPSTFRQTEYNKDRAWASAQFRFWLPGGPRGIAWSRRMKAAIFGLNPTPYTVYKAIPWSWLIDWFTTLGPTLSNLEGGVADRCAADYFYVMRHIENTREYYAQTFLKRQSGEQVKVSGTCIGTTYHKIRTPGDPFGWNTNENNLNGMQLSILGALGMSRLR